MMRIAMTVAVLLWATSACLADAPAMDLEGRGSFYTNPGTAAGGLQPIGAPVTVTSGTNNVDMGVNVSDLADADFIVIQLHQAGAVHAVRSLFYLKSELDRLGPSNGYNPNTTGAPINQRNVLSVPLIAATNQGRRLGIYRTATGALRVTPPSTGIANIVVQLYTLSF